MAQDDLFDTPTLRYLRVKEKYLSELEKFRSKDWTRGKNRVVTLDKLIKFANEVKAFHEFNPRDVEKDIIGILSDQMIPSMPYKFQEDMFSDLVESPDEKWPEVIIELLEKHKNKDLKIYMKL